MGSAGHCLLLYVCGGHTTHIVQHHQTRLWGQIPRTREQPEGKRMWPDTRKNRAGLRAIWLRSLCFSHSVPCMGGTPQKISPIQLPPCPLCVQVSARHRHPVHWVWNCVDASPSNTSIPSTPCSTGRGPCLWQTGTTTLLRASPVCVSVCVPHTYGRHRPARCTRCAQLPTLTLRPFSVD